MRRLLLGGLVSALFLSASVGVQAAKPVQINSEGVETAWEKSSCVTIQSGLLTDSAGVPLVMGYDEFGYNYQAHMFNGTYDSVDRNLDGKYYGSTGDFVDDRIVMKWSDEWLSNVSCDGDYKLDRGPHDYLPGGTSLGWTTNHVEGEYLLGDGTEQHYTYFAKIGWVGAGGNLWGAYQLLQENYQDPTGMSHEKFVTPGLGLNDHWTSL